LYEWGRRWAVSAACTCFSIIFNIGGGCRARAHERERRKQLNVQIYIIFNLNEIEFIK
jgi:hypothetical protein